jgi:aminoglycoside phosphotransferase (APT) family kinase protein
MPEAGEFLEVLRRNGQVTGAEARLVPLSGGVSSEIFLVEDGAERFVVKRALPKLKVKDDWFADIGRNRSEWQYMECVGGMMPGVTPQLRFSSPDEGYFGMEYLGDGFANWKSLLLAGECSVSHAETAGKILGEIHRRTCGVDRLRAQFDTTANFHQLRVEPYLLTTGARHPELQALFNSEARRIEATREALVHGDFSPKNILIRGGRMDRMVLLDCEVAWYGDPTFDVAFFLNHLFLKGLYHAGKGLEFEPMADTFWRAYASERTPAHAAAVESRLPALLLMLLLARVDGKSPVEYLTAPKQEFIRALVHKHLPAPPDSLAGLRALWFAGVNEFESTQVSA